MSARQDDRSRLSLRERAAALRRLDTALLSDAIERVGGGGVPLGLRAMRPGPRRIAGPAVTVELGPADGASPAVHLGARAVDAAREGSVFVVANGGRTDIAVWGGLLSTAAAVRGAEGVIVDGACRDVEEIGELGIEVFCRGVAPVTARGRVVERSSGQPVKISEVSVFPGDWVVGDATGVVILLADRLDDVLSVAGELAELESGLRRELLARRPAAEVLGRGYESMARGES